MKGNLEANESTSTMLEFSGTITTSYYVVWNLLGATYTIYIDTPLIDADNTETNVSIEIKFFFCSILYTQVDVKIPLSWKDFSVDVRSNWNSKTKILVCIALSNYCVLCKDGFQDRTAFYKMLSLAAYKSNCVIKNFALYIFSVRRKHQGQEKMYRLSQNIWYTSTGHLQVLKNMLGSGPLWPLNKYFCSTVLDYVSFLPGTVFISLLLQYYRLI